MVRKSNCQPMLIMDVLVAEVAGQCRRALGDCEFELWFPVVVGLTYAAFAALHGVGETEAASVKCLLPAGVPVCRTMYLIFSSPV